MISDIAQATGAPIEIAKLTSELQQLPQTGRRNQETGTELARGRLQSV